MLLEYKLRTIRSLLIIVIVLMVYTTAYFAIKMLNDIEEVSKNFSHSTQQILENKKHE